MLESDRGPDPVHPSACRIVYQPLIDLRAWRVIGVEALARFADGRSPLAHLAAADARGDRIEFELRLIAAAVADAATLPPELFVTLNASGETVLHPGILDAVAEIDRAWGLEVFEGATSADLGAVRRRVRMLGGQLFVDDAGAASADAERVRALRPDVVKIDRARFWEIAADPTALTHLEPVLAASRSVGAQVLVEGISEPDHVEKARGFGADLGQGFHLGMPTPASDFRAMLSELHRSIGVDAPGL